jgi:hypothetical protein
VETDSTPLHATLFTNAWDFFSVFTQRKETEGEEIVNCDGGSSF